MNGALQQQLRPAVKENICRLAAAPQMVPPFTNTAQPSATTARGRRAHMLHGHRLAPEQHGNSSRLGVMTVASGKSFSVNALIADGFSNLTPLVESMTGSMTSFEF